ncbi:membrane dipeptidase [Maioricimonas sp. JC845]|uniref:dipeptidase n=1 Tax=Maioricimonas sp. JC845 TaxID=3232138 RepID=UPI00345A46D3
MLIFDAHLDIAWNAVEWNRNLELSVEEIRKFEKHFTDIVPGDCTVSYPELRRGGIGIMIATLLPRLHRKDKELTFYQSREAAYGMAMGQLAYYRAMCAKGVLRELPDAAAVQSHVKEWEAYVAGGSQGDGPPLGFILSMEGAPPILHPEQVHEWYESGLRIIGPAHYGPNEYCHGTGSEGGLTEDGRQLIREMNKAGMLLDATHLADQSFWEALEIFDGPVLASHHNCRALVPGDRQLDDDQIKTLIERGGVIGAAFDNWMLTPGWKKYVTPLDQVTLENVANHIDHVCQLAGNCLHSGIGTDLDGGFGKEQSPSDMETIAEIGKVAEILDRRGYASDDIERIMYRNFVDFFGRAWA